MDAGKLGRRAVVWGLAGITVASVLKELGKPPEERTWQGRTAGVPYDFRPPTLERVRRSFWQPDSDEILTPRAFGVGWGVNVARLIQLAGQAADAAVSSVEIEIRR